MVLLKHRYLANGRGREGKDGKGRRMSFLPFLHSLRGFTRTSTKDYYRALLNGKRETIFPQIDN